MGLGSTPDVLPNVVPMMAGVERAFDSYRMCAVPSRDAVTEDVSFEASGSSHLCAVGACLHASCRQGCASFSSTCFLPIGLMHVIGRVLKSPLIRECKLFVACVMGHAEHCYSHSPQCCVQL
jgi:hypothetical protein